MSGANPQRLSTLADVDIPGTPTAGDLLIWSATAGPLGTGAWVNKTEAAAGNVTTAVALTANALILGAGGTTVGVMPTLGTATTVLHGNAAGAPTFGAVVLSTDVSGVLPVANGGTGVNTLTAHGVLVGEGAGNIVATAVGVAGQVLTSNGPGLDPTFQSGAAGGLIRAVQILTASGNYTVPAGCHKIIVKMLGGGGGGGGCATVAADGGAAGGGSGSPLLQHTYVGLTPGTVVAFTIGAGGAAGTNVGGNGGEGNDTTFDNTNVLGAGTLDVVGGNGGTGDTATAVAHIVLGALGNVSAAGDYPNAQGDNGSNGIVISTTVVMGGDGGGSILSAGGRGGPPAGGAGTAAGANTGAGGGGASVKNGSAAAAGGPGGSGVITIYEFS